jgi:hypothetical protein
MTVSPAPISAVPAVLLAMRPPSRDSAVAAGAMLLACGLLWLLARRAGPDGPDDDGHGGRGTAPDEPPPGPMRPVCWSELERQFAEEVPAGSASVPASG